MTGPAEYLVTGGGGMLATALEAVARERGLNLSAYLERDLDITEEVDVRDAFAGFSRRATRHGARGVVINAAAYTDVEAAEDHQETAYDVNEAGARTVAVVARDEGLGLVHVSTDFVFDGEKGGPYREKDVPNPLNVYGASKLAGERAVAAAYPSSLLVRTAWVFGPSGESFPAKILRLAGEKSELQVVTDEVGSPTYTMDLAEGILGLVAAGARGVYHLAGRGSCSRYELAVETLRLAGMDVEVEGVEAYAFPTKARRPKNSVLDCTKAGLLGVPMPAWQDGLARFVELLTDSD